MQRHERTANHPHLHDPRKTAQHRPGIKYPPVQARRISIPLPD